MQHSRIMNEMKNNRDMGFTIFNAAIVFIFLLGLSACTYDSIKYIKPETPAVVSFSNDIIPFFESTCAKSGCHANGGITPDLSTSSAYNSLTQGGYIESDTSLADQSAIYQKISSGSMAKYANDQDRALLLKWIEQGAQNN